MLLEIIEIKHNSMMITASGKNPIFDPGISALIDCIIQMCEQAAEAHMSKGAIHSSRRSRTSSDLNKSSVDAIFKNSSSLATSQPSETPSKIFLINCLCAIRQPVFGHEVASKYIMEKEVDAILRRCRLLNKMSHFHKTLTGEESPLADIEDTSPASLSESLKSLFGLILGSESSLPEFKQMHIPKLRSEACIQVTRSLVEAYELIYKAIMDPKNRYPDPKSLARHPPGQIRTILGI